MRSLLGIQDLDGNEIEWIVKHAGALADDIESDRDIERWLQGRTVGLLFFEPSTRTSLSFQVAARRLGAEALHLPEDSSLKKGESFKDTVLTVEALGADVLVIRHSETGAAHQANTWVACPVVNAGDGIGEHPTQALLDIVTLTRHFGGVSGLRLAIVGDVSHSRVARSLVQVLPRIGVGVTVVAPPEWSPSRLPDGARHSVDLDDILPEVDVVYLLRVQGERGAVASSTYVERFGLDIGRLDRMRESAVVMHPGPINRGIEIADDVADHPRSLILEQVRNGVPTRMAVLGWVTGHI